MGSQTKDILPYKTLRRLIRQRLNKEQQITEEGKKRTNQILTNIFNYAMINLREDTRRYITADDVERAFENYYNEQRINRNLEISKQILSTLQSAISEAQLKLNKIGEEEFE